MDIVKLQAWAVHFYTALGLVAAAGMAVCIVRGDPASLNLCIGLMIVATFIDATDGWLARRARVKETLPQIDGRRMDDIVDFQTYTSLPLLFLWRIEILPGRLSWWLLAPLLASLYGFSQSEAKTEDHYFLGFPSYWNVIAMYFYWLRPSPAAAIVALVSLSLLTFVPSLYLYTSRGGRFSGLTNSLCLLWGLALFLIVAGAFEDPTLLIYSSLTFPIYYFALSWWITLERWLGKKNREPFESSVSALEE